MDSLGLAASAQAPRFSALFFYTERFKFMCEVKLN
jgi:hypothetical protein